MGEARRKIFAIVLVFIVTAACAAFCAFTYISNLYDTLLDDVESRLLEVSKQAEVAVDSQFTSGIDELESLSKFISMQGTFDLESSLEILQNYQDKLHFYRMGIILPDGRGYADDIHGTSFADREYFQKSMAGESNISPFMKDRTTDVPDSTFAVPIYGQNQEVAAVLAAAKPVSVFAEILNMSIFEGEGFLMIAGSDGTVLAAADHKNYDTKIDNLNALTYKDGESWRQAAEKQSSGVLRMEAAACGEQYAAYTPVGINGWYVLAVVPNHVANDTIRTLTITSILMWAGLAAVFLMIAAYIFYVKSKSEKQLEEIAFVDPVTKGANYNAFVNAFQRQMDNAPDESFALVMMDIEKFKVLNDIFGFQNGSRMLSYIMSTFEGFLGKNEIIARVSGDNFLILLEYESKEIILERMRKIIADIDSRIHSYKLILTYGICIIENHADSLNVLSDRANLAKREIKGGHETGGAFYTKDMSDRMVKEKAIENIMDEALQQEQFKVYLQPEISFADGRLIGAEALVRWVHPEKGIISPAEFIPLFEKNHFIEKLDYYMFEQTCRLIEAWQRQNDISLPELISVNLSRVHLIDEALPGRLFEIAQAHGVSPQFIGIELTESAFFGDEKLLIQTMGQLRAIGFRIFMDDFGAGYSSLSILKDMQVDYLKFDSAFLGNLEKNLKGQDILRNLVNMAKDLKLITLAEGVETAAQAKYLKAIGFDIAQGYYYARPMPAEEMTEMLRGGMQMEGSTKSE